MKNLVVLTVLTVLSACASNREPYTYKSPIVSGEGCPPLAGTYALTDKSSITDASKVQEERSVIAGFYSVSGQSRAHWDEFLARTPEPKSVRMVISGNPSDSMVITLTSPNSGVIDTIHISKLKKQYKCENGSLILSSSDSDSVDHEVGSSHHHFESSISVAADGALVKHTFYTKRGWAWFVPYVNTDEYWAVIPRENGK